MMLELRLKLPSQIYLKGKTETENEAALVIFLKFWLIHKTKPTITYRLAVSLQLIRVIRK